MQQQNDIRYDMQKIIYFKILYNKIKMHGHCILKLTTEVFTFK